LSERPAKSPPGRGRPKAEAQRWKQVSELGLKLLSPVPGEDHAHHTLADQRDLILEAAGRLLKAQPSLWLAEELFTLVSGKTPAPSPASPSEPTTEIMRCAFHSQKRCSGAQPSDPGQFLDDNGAELVASPPVQVIAVPLTAEEPETHHMAVLGVLQVEALEGTSFSKADLSILDGICAQAALALQSLRQAALERWLINQLSLVHKVSAQIANVRDLNLLTRQVTRLIRDTFDYYFVAIFTLEPGNTLLHFRSSSGPGSPASRNDGGEVGPAPEFIPSFTIHIGQGLIGSVAETGEEILANDVSTEPRYRFTDSLPETQAEFGLPLKIEDRVLGVLDVQSDQVGSFSQTDALVLRALASNIASALESARLYSALLWRAEQLSTLYEVSNAITSILDLDELLKSVVDLVHTRFGYPYVHIFSVHPGRKKIFYEAGSGVRSSIFKEMRYSHDLDEPDGIIPWVARKGETVLANDVEIEPRYKSSELPPEVTRAELAVPLIFGGSVLGVLDVQSDRLNAFGEDDRFLFEALADNIAVAMRNASLYRSETWRRQVAEGMREVAGLLSADADLDQVLDAILTELDRTLPCDVAAIWLLNENNGLEHHDSDEADETLLLHLAAVRGENTSGMEPGISLPVRWRNQDPEAAISPGAWLGEALYADQPLIRSFESPYEPIGLGMDFPPDYSAIASPLKIGEQRLGVLVLSHHTSGRYGSEASSMTAVFASYAAVAIENTRLYEAAHEQAWVSTVLLQVSDATQAVTNLHELLATVVRITPLLVGVRACGIYIVDDEEAFIPAASYGFTAEQQAEFERWRVAPGEAQAFDQLYEEKRPLVLSGEEIDPLLIGILTAGEEADPKQTEILVMVPLLARGEVMGALVVDYSESRSTSNGSRGGLEAVFDERLAIIQGVAHQTATAVENIRLLKTQREEAYVSVALLQVAQAVVSANDLDEALGAIVRITPILVGVKRSLIYLWDPIAEVFYLTESYGLPRDVGQEVFTPEEFPLLDAVRKWDTLMAFPLEGAMEDDPEIWSRLPVPDLDVVDDLLETSTCLLLAFPLSMKGKVLGVLLVEEPPPSGLDPLDGSGGWRRLREKRLEITTGISQQAALAIQNSQLQQEMVERERLEREFQLAREIQITFLPHEIPDLPGWDLNVRWRTAREVGGDFYDFFELNDGRFGLVVADVADKGMPAALFMILVRTLVRAAMPHASSPAAVLEQVNEILVPDAQRGMFVTIVYAVVDLETGLVQFANAGHNPPYRVRPGEDKLAPLERGGMALGVLPGTEISQGEIELQPGDCLIMYTDGVTEAFSPDGEMFGDQRLLETLLGMNAGIECAEQALDAIENALVEFVQDAPRADDLTLLALKRE
jgi:phosphoserine phosphatase RsbU/P